jgi:hypothetical protein
MMIKNYGRDEEGLKERRGGAKEQQRRPRQVGVPIQVELTSNSDSRNSPRQNCGPNHIPTLFWTFLIWMEIEEDQLSNGTSLISKFLLSPREMLKQWCAQNLSRCCVIIFWPRGLCIKLDPIGARPRVRAWPSPRLGHPLPLSYTPYPPRTDRVLLIRFSSCYFGRQHVVG